VENLVAGDTCLPRRLGFVRLVLRFKRDTQVGKERGFTLKRIILALFALSTMPVFAQTWKSEVITDALRGTQHTQYTLQGVYLTPPSKASADETPSLVLRCQADVNAAHGHTRGKFLGGFVYTHSVVDSGGASGGDIKVHYRRDDGKVQEDTWNHSTDFSSAFFDNTQFNTMVFGHFMGAAAVGTHKTAFMAEAGSPQTHKLVIEMSEFMASSVVVQFTLPDDSDVLETCGALWHK
jgi:hypothetical protein